MKTKTVNVNPATQAAYIESKRLYDEASAKSREILDVVPYLLADDPEGYLQGICADVVLDPDVAKMVLNDAEANLIGEYFDHCQSIGADLTPFGSPHLAIRQTLIQLALKQGE